MNSSILISFVFLVTMALILLTTVSAEEDKGE
jgi:hypothetical protein